MTIDSISVSPEAGLEEAKNLWSQGKATLASEELSKVLQRSPDFAPALTGLAVIHTSRKEFDKAISCCNKVVQLQPSDPTALAHLAQVMFEQGKIQEAIATYLKAFAMPGQTADSIRLICQGLMLALRKNGLLDQAICVYSTVIDSLPAIELEINEELLEIIHCELGHLIVDLSRLTLAQSDQGVTFFRKALESQPGNQWFRYHLARALAKQKHFDESIALYKDIVRLQPEFYLAQVQLGKLLLGKGDPDGAIQCGVKALQSKPNAWIARDWLQDLGLFHISSSNSESFERREIITEAYRMAIENIESSTDSGNQDCLFDLYRARGKVLFQQEKLSEAIKCYQKSIHLEVSKHKGDYVQDYWNVGKLQEPDFLILGVMKCGTTAIYDYMVQHPQILPAIEKEPHFLNNQIKIQAERKILDSHRDFYFAHFPPRLRSTTFMAGEASYSNIFPGIENIVSSLCPNVKLILILRNPVKRVISQYFFFLSIGWERRPLEEVIDSEIKAFNEISNSDQSIKLESDAVLSFRHYLVHGLYFYFLERWMNVFPKEQFLILRTEDLAKNSNQVMNQVFDFLDLPENPYGHYTPSNKGAYPKNIDENLLSRLVSFYQPHNQRLEEYLGRKFDW